MQFIRCQSDFLYKRLFSKILVINAHNLFNYKLFFEVFGFVIFNQIQNNLHPVTNMYFSD